MMATKILTLAAISFMAFAGGQEIQAQQQMPQQAMPQQMPQQQAMPQQMPQQQAMLQQMPQQQVMPKMQPPPSALPACTMNPTCSPECYKVLMNQIVENAKMSSTIVTENALGSLAALKLVQQSVTAAMTEMNKCQ